MNVLVIFQFAAIILLIYIIYEQSQDYFVATRTIKNVCTENCYYIKHDDAYSTELSDRQYEYTEQVHEQIESYQQKLNDGEITEEEFDAISKTLWDECDKKIEEENLDYYDDPIDAELFPYVKEVYRFDYVNAFDAKEGGSWISMLSKSYADKLNIRMASGEWISQTKATDEYLGCVALTGSGYSVGDIIDLCSMEEEINEDGRYIFNNIPLDFKAKIIGLIDAPYYDYAMKHGSLTDRYLDIALFLPLNDSSLYAVYNPDDPKLSSDLTDGERYCQMVTLDDNITEEQRSEFLSAVTDKKYEAINMKTTYENTYARDKKDFMNDIVFLSVAAGIAIVCLIGTSALTVSKELKTYSIYCLCGMTKKQCVGINAVYIGISIIISSLIAFGIKLTMSYLEYMNVYNMVSMYDSPRDAADYIKFSSYFSFGINEIILTFVLLVVAFASAMVIPYITLQKLQPVQILKEK